MILIILLFISYFYLILNTNFNKIIMYYINDKYNNKSYNYKEYLLYNSLNKMVTLDEEVKYNEEIINDIVSVNYNESKPIIYIYNTHDYEEYSNVFSSDYSIVPSVKIASYMLKDYLNDKGINSYVESNSITKYLKDNNKNYYYSYDASRYYLNEAKVNNEFKIYIDIHRDSIKYKNSIYIKDNVKYAKVLFVLAKGNKNYKYNEEFINTLNNLINKNYDGLSRGILNRNNVIFNQDISNYAILLEVGGVDNNIEEVNNTMKVIAEVLKEYIDNEGING